MTITQPTGDYISRITLPDLSSENYLNGATKTYEIKDTWARNMISTLSGSAINYRGKTKTTLVSGETNPNIQIYTRVLNAQSGIQEIYESYTAVRGDVVLYIDPDKTAELRSSYTGPSTIAANLDYTIEYIYDGVSWQEFGSTNEFGELAFKDSASASYRPTGTVSQPTFTGTAVRLVTSNISVPTSATFTGSPWVETLTGTTTGTVTTITRSITNKTATVSAAPSGHATYTPTGTISTPSISLKTAGSTQGVADKWIMTDLKLGSLLSDVQKAEYIHWPNIFSVNESNETLQFDELWFKLVAAVSGTTDNSYNLTSLGVTRQTYQLKDADGEYRSNTPTFTGTGVRLVTDNIPVPSAYISEFSGGSASISVNYTPTGTIGLTNSNTTATVSAASSGTATYTPSGTVSQPTFTGTQATITVQ